MPGTVSPFAAPIAAARRWAFAGEVVSVIDGIAYQTSKVEPFLQTIPLAVAVSGANLNWNVPSAVGMQIPEISAMLPDVDADAVATVP